MPRILALEWDSREARLAVADARRGGAVVEQAFVVPLPSRSEGATGVDPAIGDAIGAALAARGLSRMPTLVAVGRASIELKLLTLPPAPDDELPELVRFQAQREFNSLGDDWHFDFVPISDDVAAPRQVLAAAVSPEVVQQINDTCQRAGLKPTRLLLRPYAAASLLRRSRLAESGQMRLVTGAAGGAAAEAVDNKVRMLVDLLGDEADLTALVGSQVVYLRTARLPTETASDAGPDWRPLLAEIRRTMAAVQNQLGGQRVQVVYLCDGRQEHAALASRLSGELSLPVELFDPLTQVPLAGAVRAELPAHAGRFAPLVGMLVNEVEKSSHGLDFFNPRRRPPPPDRRRPLALAAAGAALVVAVLGSWAWLHLRSLDARIEELGKASKKADAEVAAAAKLQQSAGELDDWRYGDAVWLDELARLSRALPDAKQVMLGEVNMSPHAAGGEMVLKGVVSSTQVVDRLEGALRDNKHRVEGRGSHQDVKNTAYPWQFSSAVIVETRPAKTKAKTSAPAQRRPVAAPPRPSGKGP
jgi:Tfp pilus assembly PilM family ATPase